jgi:hypothetical protein
MTAWFARVGQPLSAAERTLVDELAKCVAPHAHSEIAALASWPEAAAFVRASEFDATWWDQEEQEREWLWTRATQHQSESDLLRHIDRLLSGLEAAIRAGAAAAATAAGVADSSIVGEATGAALLAAQHRALAELAGEDSSHRFARKYALFAAGRWPLGYHAARFAIF